MHPQCPHPVLESRLRRRKSLFYRALPGQRLRYSRGHPDQYRCTGERPDWQIGSMVSGIAELRANGLLDASPFLLSFEVIDAVAGDHLVEQTQMVGHCLGDTAICCGCQHQLAAPGFFRPEIGQ